MKILKFGGSSIATPERIRSVIQIIKESAATNNRIAIVVSAFGGVTDTLIEISKIAASGDIAYREALQALETRHVETLKELVPPNEQSQTLLQLKMWLNDLDDVLNGVRLVGELSERCLDYVMSFGELFSARIIADAARQSLPGVLFLDARSIIRTNYDFGNGKVDFELSYQQTKNVFAESQGTFVVTGFIASTDNHDTTTLGRGGSDYTASLIGAALSVEEIEIWTDVDGLMTADPRKVKKAFSQAEVSYEEAMELSHFGAKVIYPPTMLPALEKQIPIRIRNTFNPAYAGTLVNQHTHNKSKSAVTGISSISEVALLRVSGGGMVGVAGIARRLFTTLADASINVILITQASSEHTICFAVHPGNALRARVALEQEFELEIARKRIGEISVEQSVSIISVVGDSMRNTPGISGRTFHALGKNGVNIIAIAQGSSERNISMVLAATDERKALNALHEEFFFPENKSINVFLVGTGLIGSALLKQIETHAATLQSRHAHDIRIVGIANSTRFLMDREAFPLSGLKERLLTEGKEGSIADFITAMRGLNISNSVFVDCTASESVCTLYPEVLKQSISIVTPNKKAQSASLDAWKQLMEVSKPRGVEFLFETSVGAGLPVISTLNDLLKSGDRVLKIEAVLSGTLSYIFNSFGPGNSFSEVVAIARQSGYTEPDPRDDLNGLDVARKILILSRVAGNDIEMADIVIENLVPEECRQTDSIDAFMSQLKEFDSAFEKRRAEAEQRGCKLCYIASLKDGKAQVALQEVDQSHPFYSLSGSDNIISFTTERYLERPLVVKGPGAGAEVTAAGVFADIIRIAS